MDIEKRNKCSVESCNNKFKYKIPKTTYLACSLECYKKIKGCLSEV